MITLHRGKGHPPKKCIKYDHEDHQPSHFFPFHSIHCTVSTNNGTQPKELILETTSFGDHLTFGWCWVLVNYPDRFISTQCCSVQESAIWLWEGKTYPVSKFYKLLLKVTWSYLAIARTAGGTGRPLLPWWWWKDIQLETIHFFDFCDIIKFILSFKTLLFIFQRHFSPLFSSNRRFPSAFIKSQKLMDSAAFCPPAWLWSIPDICQFWYTTALCRLGL